MFLDIFGYVCVAQKPFSASKACNAKHRLIETKQSSVKESTIISHQGLLNELHRVESWNNIRNGKALLVLWVNHCDHLHSLVNSAIQACHTFKFGKEVVLFLQQIRRPNFEDDECILCWKDDLPILKYTATKFFGWTLLSRLNLWCGLSKSESEETTHILRSTPYGTWYA